MVKCVRPLSSCSLFASYLQGVLHTVSGYMLYTAFTFKLVFDYQPNDIYWCTADIGWITGHSYIAYGPLAMGASSVLVSAGSFLLLQMENLADEK